MANSDLNPERNPNDERFAPGDDPVPEEDWIPERPSDSAEWANLPLPQYEGGPLFPDDPNPTDPDEGEQEASNG